MCQSQEVTGIKALLGAAVVLGVLLLGSPALADEPERTAETPATAPCPCERGSPSAYTHDGFYLRAGVGPGFVSIVGSGDAGRTSVTGFGTSALMLAGGTPARGLVVGGGIHVASVDDGVFEGGPLDGYHVSGSAISLGPFVDWYPDPHDGWHVGFLAGIGGAQLEDSAVSLGSVGLSGVALGGYDAWIGPQWSVGALAMASASTPGRLERDGSDSGYRATPLAISLIATLTCH